MHNCCYGRKLFYIVLIGLLVLYLFSRISGTTDSFNNIIHGPALRSFGNPDGLSELNETKWTPNCFPHGEYYVMRYGRSAQI
jgi:hypothetical protein